MLLYIIRYLLCFQTNRYFRKGSPPCSVFNMSRKKLSSVTHIFSGGLDHNGSPAAIDHDSFRFLILSNEVTGPA